MVRKEKRYRSGVNTPDPLRFCIDRRFGLNNVRIGLVLAFVCQRRHVVMENGCNIRSGQEFDAAQEFPLVRVGDKIIIDKNTVAASAGDFLQRKGNALFFVVTGFSEADTPE